MILRGREEGRKSWGGERSQVQSDATLDFGLSPFDSILPLMQLILASQSQGRAALLKGAGLRFRQIPSHVLEPAPAKGENLERHVLTLACLKAEAIARQYPRAMVIGADTALILGNQIIGKPASLAEARAMLARLGRRPHRISSAACVIIPAQGKGQPPRRHELVESATVTLRRWSPARLRQHVALTRPLAWAGAYAVQDPYSATIVKHIEGDLAPVIGLPLEGLLSLVGELKVQSPKLTMPIFSSSESRLQPEALRGFSPRLSGVSRAAHRPCVGGGRR